MTLGAWTGGWDPGGDLRSGSLPTRLFSSRLLETVIGEDHWKKVLGALLDGGRGAKWLLRCSWLRCKWAFMTWTCIPICAVSFVHWGPKRLTPTCCMKKTKAKSWS